MLTYLLINSGSRFDEINNGKFKAMDDGFVELSNISKTRDKKRKIKKELLDLNPSKFMDILTRYRALQKPQESAIVQLNEYLKKEYNFTSYNLRKYYANVSFHLLEDKNITQNAYLSNVLGHDNDETARCYSSFRVISDEAPTFR